MKKGFTIMTCLVAATTLAGCITVNTSEGAGVSPPPQVSQSRNVGNIFITTHTGAPEIINQQVVDGGARPGITRICLQNNKGGPRSLRHTAPNINTLATSPGGRSCANFQSSDRVRFFPFTGDNAVRASQPDFVYSLSAYEGDLLTLTWQ